ncbi:hypothetical protein LELG_02084 [Lodderomyces elongisporus NRRL YB-4239]|uniref:glucan 1,4-alpha-glucosidase n=1 Tax=Lodderomyces elongisporus (strain ATCC 11503 / CBS 2605 / JCM 1781 / NBRC 1676 / NRRL YB-4239) TaxID=379508 RepID=A5DXJ7_LODEL|nr:hypothetical protein LELG_02084 [Lodderomyces elongisporus NRRL YB-4239]
MLVSYLALCVTIVLVMNAAAILIPFDDLTGLSGKYQQWLDLFLKPSTDIFQNTISYFKSTSNDDVLLQPSFSSSHQPKAQFDFSQFESWLENQQNISLYRILDNVIASPSTSKIINDNRKNKRNKKNDVVKNVLVASPSRNSPDYFYQWIRDSAITIKTLMYALQENPEHELNTTILDVVHSYVCNNWHLQRTKNPLGGFDMNSGDNKGLGEPKFNVDGLAFEQNWGRPQRDGPALRTLANFQYLRFLEENVGNFDMATPWICETSGGDTYGDTNDDTDGGQGVFNGTWVYHEIIRPDLNYIIQYWNRTDGFDLWEEMTTPHFFTLMVLIRAVRDAVYWALHFNDVDLAETLQSAYDAMKIGITRDTASGGLGFINSEVDYLVEHPELYNLGQRTGLDIATILAVMYTHEHDGHPEQNSHPSLNNAIRDIPFNATNHKILNSLAHLVVDMQQRFPINKQFHFIRGSGVALGRYPEDVYDGVQTSVGNPWFLATSAAGELVYQFIYGIVENDADLVINKENRAFFLPFLSTDSEKQIDDNVKLVFASQEYNLMIQKLKQYADSFLAVVKFHTDSEGHLSEQFNRNNGYMQGAKDLTWSYGALWTAVRWRTKTLNLLNNKGLNV